MKNFLDKFHQFLFKLLVLLLPVQLGKHFWPQFSYVFGLPIDYLSPTLFLTDILIVGILASYFFSVVLNLIVLIRQSADGGFRDLNKFRSGSGMTKRLFLFFFIFLFLVISSFFAKSKGVAFYKFIKLLEFFLLGLYIAKNLDSLFLILDPLFFAVVYSCLIAIGQFLNRGTLGGVFWWLGERSFGLNTPGITNFALGNRLYLRPYATFPHPNVLAGFLLVSLILITFRRSKKIDFFYWLVVVLNAATLFLCFSRLIWLVGLLVVVARFKAAHFFGLFELADLPVPDRKGRHKSGMPDRQNRRSARKRWRQLKLVAFLLFVVLVILLFWKVPSLFRVDPLSFSRRIELAKSAIQMIKDQPVFGVGMGNFIIRLPDFWQGREGVRFVQPVHNIFLLVAAETGLIGLTVFVLFLFFTFKKLLVTKNQLLITALGSVLLIGLFDHYWLTLQQGQLIFTLILGLAWRDR